MASCTLCTGQPFWQPFLALAEAPWAPKPLSCMLLCGGHVSTCGQCAGHGLQVMAGKDVFREMLCGSDVQGMTLLGQARLYADMATVTCCKGGCAEELGDGR